ncbi:MAG TPA: ATP-binding protein [Roseiflexaceae bacterium]|nr:ATP-binding protein [Roseiflexaceae bacterium]
MGFEQHTTPVIADAFEALRASEERFRRASDAAGALVYDVDLLGQRPAVVHGLERVVGLAPESIVLTSDWWHARIHPEDLPAHLENLERSLRSGAIYRAAYRVRHADGRWLYAEDTAEVIRDDAGLPVRLVGAVVDVTQRKQAEEALKRSEAKFATAFNAGPIILTMTRVADGRLVEVNESFLTTTGYTRDEVLGRTPVELGLWVDPAQREAGLARLRRGERVREVEADFRMKNGEVRTCLMSGELIEVDGERCVLTALTDITERKRAEQDTRLIAELAERIRLAEDADELLWATQEVVGEYLRVRRCFFAEVDVPNDRGLVRRDYCRGVPSLVGEYRLSACSPVTMAEIMAGRTIVNCDTQADRRTAPLYESTYRVYGERAYMAVPLMREGHWVAALRVSTDEPRQWEPREVALLEAVAERAWLAVERLRLYAAERRARAVAEAAVRARDQFLQIASHELKNPLTSLLGNAQLLTRRDAREHMLSERDRRTVRTIVDQAVRLNELVATLLDISRLEAGQVRITRAPLDLAALVRRVVEAARPSLTQHTIEVQGAEALPVEGDAIRLEQVFQNLVGNAVKYSPAGGQITVQVDEERAMARVRVTDEGIGIPAADLPHLFERFYRVSSAEAQQISGTGIGLYVVKEIVTLHGGEVTVESVEGQGSTFTVWLPLGQASPGASHRREPLPR